MLHQVFLGFQTHQHRDPFLEGRILQLEVKYFLSGFTIEELIFIEQNSYSENGLTRVFYAATVEELELFE